MNRRTFLKALATTLAAAAVVSPAELLFPATPAIDWGQWTRVGLRSGPDGVAFRVNGLDVTAMREVVAKIAGLIQIDHERGLVHLGPPMKPGERILTMSVPQMASAKVVQAEFTYRGGRGKHGLFASFDDLWVNDDGGQTVRWLSAPHTGEQA